MLKKRLRLHRRMLPEYGPAHGPALEEAVDILKMLTGLQPSFAGWGDFVKQQHRAAVEAVLGAHDFFGAGYETHATSWTCAFPPQVLHHDCAADTVCRYFRVVPELGLSAQQVREYAAFYKGNRIPAVPFPGVLRLVAAQLGDFVMLTMLVAMVVAAITDYPDWTAPGMLLAVVASNVGVGVWQEWRAIGALKRLLQLQKPPTARVVRHGGQEQCIAAGELVPGDIVLLGEGDVIPADLRIIAANHFEAVESILTGEAQPVAKDARAITSTGAALLPAACTGNAFMACMVSRGTAVGVVVRTGERTEIGQINAALRAAPAVPDASPRDLRGRLRRLGHVLVLLSAGICGVVLGVGVLRGRPWLEMVHVAVSLAVAVVPEGLVAALAVTLSLAVARLARKNVLVRRFDCLGALATVDIVCSDKTGTLTEGRMVVRQVWLPAADHDAGALEDACLCMRLCNDVVDAAHAGDPTEHALLLHSQTLPLPAHAARLSRKHRLREIPFDSERKLMTVAHALGEARALVLCKGAPEVLLRRCVGMDAAARAVVEARVLALSSLGLRVLAMAKRVLPVPDALGMSEMELEAQLSFIGLVGIYDPPRASVVRDIGCCRGAGISVCMLTGDSLSTAEAIGRDIGLLERGSMRGRDLDVHLVSCASGRDGRAACAHSLFPDLASVPSVFARVTPQHKLFIVQALQRCGWTVAMTGDGVNDAPAIRNADIGIAMGVNGSELTKSAADIVLIDDSFSSILEAVREGRLVLENLHKFLVYLLACNSAELWIMLVAVLLDLPEPLSSAQILWSNVISEMPPSICIGCAEPPERDLLVGGVKQRAESVIGAAGWALIAVHGVVIAACVLLSFAYEIGPWALEPGRLAYAKSECFFLLTALELFYAFFARSLTQSVFCMSPLSNRPLLASVAGMFALVLANHHVPVLYRPLGLYPLLPRTWLKFGLSLVVLGMVTECVKVYLRMLDSQRWQWRAGRTRKDVCK